MQFFGFLICCSAAFLTCFAFGDHASKAFLPIVFLAVVILIALRFGSLAGIVGSCAATGIFAVLLFPPIGSMEIENVHQRSNLGWFLVAGISTSFLFAPQSVEPGKTDSKGPSV